MFCKVRIDRYAVFCHTKVHPIRLNINLSLPLLQKQNVCCHLCSRICLECSIRKPYRSHKLSPLCKVLSDGRIGFIKCSFRGNHRNHASRSHLIECFCHEIIMNTEIIFVVLWIKYLVITKWHISNNHIKEVIRICGILKSCDTDIGILIKLLCNSS